MGDKKQKPAKPDAKTVKKQPADKAGCRGANAAATVATTPDTDPMIRGMAGAFAPRA